MTKINITFSVVIQECSSLVKMKYYLILAAVILAIQRVESVRNLQEAKEFVLKSFDTSVYERLLDLLSSVNIAVEDASLDEEPTEKASVSCCTFSIYLLLILGVSRVCKRMP